jgi:hypothetical protein
MLYVLETRSTVIIGSCATVESMMGVDAAAGVYHFYDADAMRLSACAAQLHALLLEHRVGTRRGYGAEYARFPRGAALGRLANLALRASLGGPAHGRRVMPARSRD